MLQFQRPKVQGLHLGKWFLMLGESAESAVPRQNRELHDKRSGYHRENQTDFLEQILSQDNPLTH